jgi:hypothetical protein
MTQGKPPSSTGSWPIGTFTLLIYRKNASLPVAVSRRKTTRSSGKVWSYERRIYGVGFAVRNSVLLSVEPPSQGTERILSLRLITSLGPTHILNVYAPTHFFTAETKDAFYEDLETRIREIPDKENLFLHGADHTSWPRCIGHFGVGKLNENGQRLLELCSFSELRKRFADDIDKTLEDCPADSAIARWDFIRDAIYVTYTFGKRARKNNDWFDAGNKRWSLL